jgi:ABC-type amino acid transport substrate-binding protein
MALGVSNSINPKSFQLANAIMVYSRASSRETPRSATSATMVSISTPSDERHHINAATSSSSYNSWRDSLKSTLCVPMIAIETSLAMDVRFGTNQRYSSYTGFSILLNELLNKLIGVWHRFTKVSVPFQGWKVRVPFRGCQISRHRFRGFQASRRREGHRRTSQSPAMSSRWT